MKNILLNLIIVSLFFLGVFVKTTISQAKTLSDQFKGSLETTSVGAGYLYEDKTVIGYLPLPERMGIAVGSLLSLLGIMFLGLIVYSGFVWMLARGNSAEIEKAKSTIVNSIIGLLIVLASYAITKYISEVFL